MAKQAKETLGTEKSNAIADRGYSNSTEILACERPTSPRCPGLSQMRNSPAFEPRDMHTGFCCCFFHKAKALSRHRSLFIALLQLSDQFPDSARPYGETP